VRRVRTITSVLAAVSFLAAAPAHAIGLDAVTQTASGVTTGGATLTGQITPLSLSTTYYFDVGTTTAYGIQTPVTSVQAPALLQAVQAPVSGLKPGTLYHYRLVAGEGLTAVFGLDKTFRTAAAPVIDPGSTSNPADPGAGNPAENAPGVGIPDDLPLPGNGHGGLTGVTPVLGRSVGVGPAAGTVRVKLPGSARYAPLGANAPLPVGSRVDARDGVVNLATALPDSGSQIAQFSGAVFEVRQAAGAGGLTDIYLRGGSFRSCRRAAHNRVSAARARTVRRLWGRDRGGRFRTRGQHAVATVRGTTWAVADRCDGTLTKVADGAVSVRDKVRKKTVLVKAGHSYLARARRR
jgi:hypothetical protein